VKNEDAASSLLLFAIAYLSNAIRHVTIYIVVKTAENFNILRFPVFTALGREHILLGGYTL
jgi:hypothetical protein